MEEEREKTMMFSPIGEEENSKEWLKIFIQEYEQEMIAIVNPTEKEEEDIMDFVDLYE